MIVKVKLGSEWDGNKAGSTVGVDPSRGSYLLALHQAKPADEESARILGVAWSEPEKKATGSTPAKKAAARKRTVKTKPADAVTAKSAPEAEKD